ncbi:hypothetical protein [Chryseobacterium jejuense]|nr:hypothetical protein [Chryseobacterium jejuense]
MKRINMVKIKMDYRDKQVYLKPLEAIACSILTLRPSSCSHEELFLL